LVGENSKNASSTGPSPSQPPFRPLRRYVDELPDETLLSRVNDTIEIKRRFWSVPKGHQKDTAVFTLEDETDLENHLYTDWTDQDLRHNDLLNRLFEGNRVRALLTLIRSRRLPARSFLVDGDVPGALIRACEQGIKWTFFVII